MGGLNLGVEQQGAHAASGNGAHVLAIGDVLPLGQSVKVQSRSTQIQGLDLRQHLVADLQIHPTGQGRCHLRQRAQVARIGRYRSHVHSA